MPQKLTKMLRMKELKKEMVKQESKENKNQLSKREKQLVEFLVEVSIYIAKKNAKKPSCT